MSKKRFGSTRQRLDADTDDERKSLCAYQLGNCPSNYTDNSTITESLLILSSLSQIGFCTVFDVATNLGTHLTTTVLLRQEWRFFINSALLKEAYIMLRCGFNEQFFATLVNSFDNDQPRVVKSLKLATKYLVLRIPF